MTALARFTVAVLAVLFGVYVSKYRGTQLPLEAEGIDLSFPPLCPLFEPLAPDSYLRDNSTVLRILHDETYRLESASRLSAAVRTDTLVHDNPPYRPDDPEYWAKFKHFQYYLEKTFPTVRTKMRVSQFRDEHHIYKWDGSNDALKPVMLFANQDVEPVEQDSLKYWEHPPFSGDFVGGFVHGRGSSGSKNVLVAVFEALELLAEQGFQPERGVVVVVGFSKVMGGAMGPWFDPSLLARELKRFHFGVNGLFAIVAEGPGLIRHSVAGIMAVPATMEKCYLNFLVVLSDRIGATPHSLDSAYDVLSDVVREMDGDPYSLLPSGAPQVESYAQIPASWPLILLRQADCAVSRIVKHLTGYVWSPSTELLIPLMLLQFIQRIPVGTSVKEATDYLASHVERIAAKHDLAMDAFGESRRFGGTSALSLSFRSPPQETAPFCGPRSETDPLRQAPGDLWAVLIGTTRHVFEDLVLGNSTEPMVTVPEAISANSYLHHFENLTKQIVGFTPMWDSYTRSDVNEKVHIDSHLQLTAWYYEFIQNIK